MAIKNQDQQHSQQHWLNYYGLRSYLVGGIGLLWLTIFLGASYVDVDTYLDSKIADPLNFRVRDFLGRTPQQHPKLKIFALDDKTFAKLGTPMPGMRVWSEVFDSIAQKKPRLIAIDALFSARPEQQDDKVKFFMDSVKASGVPLVTGAFASKELLAFKNPLNLTGPQYAVGTYRPQVGASQDDSSWMSLHMPLWEMRENWQVYGPAVGVDMFFDRAGHFQLFRENRIDPFIWVGNDRVVPHLSMYVANTIMFDHRKLVINGRPVALDRHGEMPVNFLTPGRLAVSSLMPIIDDAMKGYITPFVDPDDVVLILPMHFTGNVDMRPSPYGLMPGGYYLAYTMNSILNGEYLQPVLAGDVLLISFVAIAAFSVYYFSASLSWVLWVGFGICYFVFVQFCFSYLNLIIPYVMPLLAGTMAAANIYALKVRSLERKAFALRAALDGAVSPDQLEMLVRRPDEVNLEPRERILTLMFIDVVGFSLSSENMVPREAFYNLKMILQRIAEIVHQHGGIIDKTLGDGLLCYFGYRFDSDETDANHPEKALRCAIKIQEQMLEEGLLAARSGAPIYPLRVGLNTASCYLGDLGSGQRIEFTVVGNGVNFAKRLESACRVYCVMIGSTTYDLVRGLPWSEGIFARKMIKIKHHADLRDAIEVDPLKMRESEVAEVLDAYHRQASFHRTSERMHIKDVGRIQVVTPAGRGRLLDFTGHGASVLFDLPRARGDHVAVRFESRIPGLMAALEQLGITSIDSEVRWTHNAADGVVHGVVFRGLRADQQEAFVRVMSEFAFGNSVSNVSWQNDVDSEAS